MSISNKQTPLFLGIDGGGTSTRAKLIKHSGEVIGHGKAGPGSLRFGIAQTIATILQAIDDALIEAKLDSTAYGKISIALGLAATERLNLREQFELWQHPFLRLKLVSDAEAACIGAHGGGDGGIVIVGTGSVGFVRNRNVGTRIGGLGFPVSDAGSGAYIGLAAARVAMKVFDKRVSMSPFCAAVLAEVGTTLPDAVEYFSSASATEFARLAPRVFEFAAAEDTNALAIVRSAAREVEDLISATHSNDCPNVCLMGGLSAEIKPYLSETALQCLVPPRGDAMDGALMLAQGTVERCSSPA